MLRSYFEYNRRNGKCDVVKLGTTIEPRIVAYLLACQSVGTRDEVDGMVTT